MELRWKSIKVLRRVNIVIGLVALTIGFYHFFIENIDFSMDRILLFLALMYALFGLEGVKGDEKNKVLAYTYLLVAVVIFSGLIIEFFKSFD
ncbi:hypothetical protein FGG79_02585 [Bacillus sp. BHET2]|uniref:hypothetical protein n=1 Tax=Bacillus sp. BHET2 TaxID=2583818 RepID=UPI00110E5866|nr:hypothetical protein [Bacillus sp. BHET2]TMU87045.1 hypothetical protein FGG79_02585 [Bacillus sp. BHET2]